MARTKIIFGIVALVLVAIVAYQIGSCEVANLELREDLRDIAAQNAPRIGLTDPNSDEEIRDSIVRSARGHGIALDSQEVSVERFGTVEAPVISLTVNYAERVNLPGFSLTFHFTPTSDR